MNIQFEKLSDGRIVMSPKDFEDLMDRMAYDEAKRSSIFEEKFPLDLTKRIIEGECAITVYREYRGMTQSALAKITKVTQATISEIENGRKSGSIKTLKAIAAALNVDLDDIV